MFQYGAYTPHPDTQREVRNARLVMGGGGVLMGISIFLPPFWRVGALVGGLALWTKGMRDQLEAGVEAKIGAEGVPSILARCASQCIVAPLQTNVAGYGSVYNRNYMAGQNRYSGTHAPSFG